MSQIKKLTLLSLMVILLSGCHEQSHHTDDFSLEIYFTPSDHDDWGWSASTSMLFDYRGLSISQADLVDFHYYYSGYHTPSIDDIQWLLWDLGGLDSDITGTLTFSDIRFSLDEGSPLLLHYGDYFSGHFVVVYGYDHLGHIYIHDPDYGTRIIHYDDLYTLKFHGISHYWESTLILGY